MKKALAIGIDDFREVREGDYYYVDKTLLIQDFLIFKSKVALITRPRRFGKTLNMTMLREFFDISKDSRDIFQGLKIMETEHADKINTMPVIYLTFKNCSGETAEEMKEGFANELWNEYRRFEDVFHFTVDRESNDYYRFYQIYEMLKKGEIKTTFLKSSLKELVKVVSIYYNSKPLVLIDEYDHPLIKAHEKGFREEFSTIYGGFLGEALKGNEYLGQALLTGIQRVAKESIFSGLNNLMVYTVSSKKFAPYFGLNTDETRQMLQDYGKELNDKLRRYYDGYIFGGISMYNPWSILYYLTEDELKPYWVNTSTNFLVKESIQHAERDFMVAFDKLILDGEVRVSVNLDASFIELNTTATLWGLLVNSGYLTIVEECDYGTSILKIPNQEVKEEFRLIVASYTRLSADRLRELFISLATNDMKKFLNIYQSLVYEYISMHDIKENSYHMLFLGMAISVSDLYKITSNIEAGDGRPDVVMESLQPDLRPHVIIELKQGDDTEKLKQEALEQILEKKYYAKLKGKVLCVGLAHNKKKCELAYKEMEIAES